MPETLFQRVVVPVVSPEDAKTTTAALGPYVETAGGTVIAVHVIEKAGGAPDKASVENRERRAEDIFAAVGNGLADTGIPLETRILYGTDVAETILDAAAELNASAAVFTPRGGSRWVKFLTGDITTKLIADTDRPVIVLPDAGDPVDV